MTALLQRSNGETVGTLDVTETDHGILHLDYAVDDNGRGAKLQERIELADGVPVQWAIDGTSLMGGSVAERFERDATGTATWESQADLGSGTDEGFYLPADSSPFALVLLTRHALASGGDAALLPAGRASVTAMPDSPVDGATVYRISGVQLHEQYVILDEAGQALTVLDGALLVAPTLVDHDAAIAAALRDMTQANYSEISQAAVVHSGERLVIENARVLDDETGRLTEPQQIVVEGTRIVSVGGRAAAAGATVVDAAGRAAIPGLHDMHAHLTPSSALMYMAAGVTEVRDMGNDNAALESLVEAVDEGRMVGPHVVAAGFIEGRSPYSARLGKVVGSLEEALDAVRWYAERGFHAIKIYNSFDPDWVADAAALAHELGMRVQGHVPAFMHADRCIAEGYDEITHLNQLALGWVLEDHEDTRTPLRLTALTRIADLDLDAPHVQRTIQTMAQHGIGLDVTLVILEQLMLSRARTVIPAHEPIIEHLPAGLRRYRKRTYVPFSDPAELDVYDRAFAGLSAIVRRLHEAGVPLWPGTDDGSGITLHRELELFVDAGIPAAEVLRIASARSAEHLHQSDRGRIAPGQVADILLVDGDPTESIRDVRNVALTIAAGRAVSPERIYRAMGMVPFAAEPAVVR